MTELVIALIGAAALVAAGVVPAVITARRVGSPNGHGSLTSMVSSVLDWVKHLDGRMDQLEHGHNQLSAKVDRYHSEDHSGV